MRGRPASEPVNVESDGRKLTEQGQQRCVGDDTACALARRFLRLFKLKSEDDLFR
jgi:hypothetical protein